MYLSFANALLVCHAVLTGTRTMSSCVSPSRRRHHTTTTAATAGTLSDFADIATASGKKVPTVPLNPSSHRVYLVDGRLWGPSGASPDPARGFPGRQTRTPRAPGRGENGHLLFTSKKVPHTAAWAAGSQPSLPTCGTQPIRCRLVTKGSHSRNAVLR